MICWGLQKNVIHVVSDLDPIRYRPVPILEHQIRLLAELLVEMVAETGPLLADLHLVQHNLHFSSCPVEKSGCKNVVFRHKRLGISMP